MSTRHDLHQAVRDSEALLSFLYAAPAALAQTTPDGQIEMMTPLFSQWLMPLARPGQLGNLFDLLEPVAPQLREQVRACAADSGLVCGRQLVEIPAGLVGPEARLWELNVLKLDAWRLMVMVSDESPRLQERLDSGRTIKLLRATLEDVLQMSRICLLQEDLATHEIQADARLAEWCRPGDAAAGPPMLRFADLLGMLHPEDRPDFARDHERALGGEPRAFHDLRLRRHDGSDVYLSGRQVRMSGPDGRPAMLVTVGMDVTDQRRAEIEHLVLGEHLRLVTESMGIGTFEYRLSVPALEWTAQTFALHGFDAPDGRTPQQVLQLTVASADRARIGRWVEAQLAGAHDLDLEYEVLPAGQAQPRRLLCQGTVRRDGDGQVQSLIGIVRDITERQRIDAELRIAAAAFDVQEGMFITDPSGRIERVNRAFVEITGHEEQALAGRHVRVLRSGLHDARFHRELAEAVRQQGQWAGEVWLRRRSGELFPAWLTCRQVTNRDGTVMRLVHTLVDIAQRKADERRIEQLAYRDGLTGLANRTWFKVRLQALLEGVRKGPVQGFVMCIDLDRFRDLNARLGHDAGDAVLQLVANRLNSLVDAEHLVARLGADEFVLLANAAPAATLDQVASQASVVAERIQATLRIPLQTGSALLDISACIGVVLLDEPADTVAEVLRRAAVALDQAQQAGCSSVRFFDPAVQRVQLEKSMLEAELRHAIAHDELVLHLQPVVEAEGELHGVEALVRWQHPRRGLLGPNVFIPVAEERGLIEAITFWVLESACRILASWRACPERAHLNMAVNISARDLHDEHFAAQVVAILQRTGADPQRLKLELTESMLLDNVEQAIERINAIRQHGVRFALDDFGTGYASLSYLRQLPLDKLKIDQSFVRNLLTDPADLKIARLIIDLGRSLGLAVVAEGIETEAQHRCLVSLGCRLFQGYLFGRPVPLSALKLPAARPDVSSSTRQTSALASLSPPMQDGSIGESVE